MMKFVLWEKRLVIFVFVSLLIMGGCSKKVATIGGSSQSGKDVRTTVEVDSTRSGAPEEIITEPIALIKSDIEENEMEVSDGNSLIVEDSIMAGGADSAESKALKDVYFQFDMATLSDKEIDVIKKNAEWIRNNRSAVIRIEGYADERGTSEYNLALGEKRAHIIRKYLAVFGVSQDRIDTISFGEEKGFCSDHNEECWAQNRRGHFVVVER